MKNKNLDIFYANDWKELNDRVRIVYHYKYETLDTEYGYTMKQFLNDIIIFIDDIHIISYDISDIVWINSDIMPKYIYEYVVRQLHLRTNYSINSIKATHLLWRL